MNYFEYMAEYIKSGGNLFGEDGKINPSFLPGVCLPVVELTTKANITQTNVSLSEAENSQLDSAWEANMPCVISVGVEGMTDVLSFAFVRHSDPDRNYRCYSGMFYHAFVGLLIVKVENVLDNAWTISVSTYGQ